MWKLPPAEIHLNVCQMVACDQKSVYAELKPPKSRFKDVKENIYFFFRRLFFLNYKKNSLPPHATSTHGTLSYAMWFRRFGAKVNFLYQKKIQFDFFNEEIAVLTFF